MLQIYKITNKINNKIYVGQTSETLQKRMSRHMGYQSKEHDSKFYRAVNKYGKENFEIKQLDTAETQEELDTKEVYWINKLDTVNNGYNSNNHKGKVGGDTLSNHPEIDIISKKISDSKMGGKNPNARQIKAINIQTNEEFYYDSMADCARAMNIKDHSPISKRCRKIIKSPLNKIWNFEYVE